MSTRVAWKMAAAAVLCAAAAGMVLANVAAWGVRRWQGQVTQWPT